MWLGTHDRGCTLGWSQPIGDVQLQRFIYIIIAVSSELRGSLCCGSILSLV